MPSLLHEERSLLEVCHTLLRVVALSLLSHLQKVWQLTLESLAL